MAAQDALTPAQVKKILALNEDQLFELIVDLAMGAADFGTGEDGTVQGQIKLSLHGVKAPARKKGRHSK